MGKSRMDNPEKLATLGTQDTRRRKKPQKKTTQRRKLKIMSNMGPTKTGNEPRCSRRVKVSSSYFL